MRTFSVPHPWHLVATRTFPYLLRVVSPDTISIRPYFCPTSHGLLSIFVIQPPLYDLDLLGHVVEVLIDTLLHEPDLYSHRVKEGLLLTVEAPVPPVRHLLGSLVISLHPMYRLCQSIHATIILLPSG